MLRWCLFLALPCVIAGQGWVEFVETSIEATEGDSLDCGIGRCNILTIGVGRGGNLSETVSAGLRVLDGTNASLGVDYLYYPLVNAWAAGEDDFKAFIIFVFDNNLAEDLKVLNLELVLTPSHIGGQRNNITVFIHDDNDGGTIAITPHVVRLDEGYGSGGCKVFAERQGKFNGRTEMFAKQVSCTEGVPEVKLYEDVIVQSAQEGFPYPNVVWQDGESGTKCLVSAYPQIYTGNNRTDAPVNLAVIPDAQREPEEKICLKAFLVENSSAILPHPDVDITLVDVDLNAILALNCTRGLDCLLDVSKAYFWPGDRGTLQDADEFTECRPCEEVENSSIPFQVFGNLWQGQSFIDLGRLTNEKPGTKLLCWCVGDEQVVHVASMELQGPYMLNAAYCVKSWPTCDIHHLEGVGFQEGTDHLRVLRSCETPQSSPPEIANGSHAIFDANLDYKMLEFETMRPARPGIYELCWCRQNASRSCDDPRDFLVPAGTFIFAGPNPRSWMLPYELSSWRSFNVSELYGISLTAEDRAMVLSNCGQEDASGINISAMYDDVSHNFDFGPIFADAPGVLAKVYKVCWCQPAHGFTCDTARDFRAEVGQVAFLCPYRQTDGDGDGVCELCPYMIQTAGGFQGAECVIDPVRFAEALLWFPISTLLFLAFVSSLRCTRSRGVVEGVPRAIEDVSQESGKLIITVVGNHSLFVYTKRSSIPVTLSNTGHFLLDSNSSKTIHFRARPAGKNTLELLDAEGESLQFRADSSMGWLHFSMPRAMLHTTIPGVKFPLVGQIVILAALWALFCFLLQPGWTELVFMTAAPLLLAFILTLIWRFTLRPASTLTRRLERFAKEIRKRHPHPKACKKGPDRAIAVREVLELHEKFSAFIKDRNMYYIDPNIIRWLTAHHKLSYAELVGPQKVQWFVSHWWGTRYQVYCMALQRHAKAVCETPDAATWGSTTYWICTFSNNQYQIKEELGSSHKESSFYLALHSGICRGTCMILDEMAMPLKRSWCLFELLQTIGLEKTQASFRGLLFCTENGVLNFGASTVEMSMQIGDRLSTLSLEDAEATTEKDKNMITELVLQEMESFEKIDTELRVHISDALGICRNRVDDDFDALFRKLGTLKEDARPDADSTYHMV